MRRVGVLERATGDLGAHACRPFRDEGDFHADASAFLGEGDCRGERLVYVADGDLDALRRHLADLDVARLEDEGRLTLQPVLDLYAPDGAVDPAAQVQRYRRLVADALADGFTGLRVAADATALVATDESHRRFLEYELAVDRFMASAPMAAMCAYDVGALGSRVGELCAVHPARRGGDDIDVGLHAYHDGRRLCLSGEIDVGTIRVLEAVAAVIEAGVDDPVVVDMRGLTFVDVHGLARLDRAAAALGEAGASLRVEQASAFVRRCCELLGFDRLLHAVVAP